MIVKVGFLRQSHLVRRHTSIYTPYISVAQILYVNLHCSTWSVSACITSNQGPRISYFIEPRRAAPRYVFFGTPPKTPLGSIFSRLFFEDYRTNNATPKFSGEKKQIRCTITTRVTVSKTYFPAQIFEKGAMRRTLYA